MHLVYVLSRGACDAIEALVVDGEVLTVGGRTATGDGGHTLDLDPQVIATNINVPRRRYNNVVTVHEYLNADGHAHSSLNAIPTWTANHRLEDLSFVHIILNQPEDNTFLATDAPNISFILRGRKITWPGQTTPAMDGKCSRYSVVLGHGAGS